jgi:hypothetical protein
MPAGWLARLIPSRVAEDLFAGWWQLLQGLGGVPRVLVWDGEGAVGQRRRRQTFLTEQAHGFRGVLGAKVLIYDPGDPEAKGLVERANGYLESSFLPGRTFHSPADFKAELADWLALVNRRCPRVLGCAPTDRIESERAAGSLWTPYRRSGPRGSSSTSARRRWRCGRSLGGRPAAAVAPWPPTPAFPIQVPRRPVAATQNRRNSAPSQPEFPG